MHKLRACPNLGWQLQMVWTPALCSEMPGATGMLSSSRKTGFHVNSLCDAGSRSWTFVPSNLFKQRVGHFGLRIPGAACLAYPRQTGQAGQTGLALSPLLDSGRRLLISNILLTQRTQVDSGRFCGSDQWVSILK